MSFLKLITLEPAAFLNELGVNFVNGASIQLDLLIWKICHLELNYTEEICANLTNEGVYWVYYRETTWKLFRNWWPCAALINNIAAQGSTNADLDKPDSKWGFWKTEFCIIHEKLL